MLDQELHSKLAELRRSLAEHFDTELFKVWSNETMKKISETRPASLEELSTIKGIGKKKLDKYGKYILATLAGGTVALAPVLKERDLFSAPPTSPEPEPTAIEEEEEKILGVHQYLEYINRILKVAEEVKVRGEISSMQLLPSGLYLTIKDKESEAVMSCYMNPYAYKGLGLPLDVGMEVKLKGFPNIYKPKGRFSFNIEDIELTGEGTLRKAYELLKAKLESEGLFERKRELPEFITNVGVITSRTGAVIDDFRKNLEPLGIRVFLKDCRVEGTQASQHILSAINYFNRAMPDLECLVVMRGGGSLEDLQAFNNETVVRAIFGSKIPTVCAIGHDRDIPLAQMVADVAPSTPTAAAQRINLSWSRLKTELPQMERDIAYQFLTALNTAKSEVESLTLRLTGNLNALFRRFDYLSEKVLQGASRIQRSIEQTKTTALELARALPVKFLRSMSEYAERLVYYEKYIEAANPERNLKLGYSLIRSENGKILRDAGKLSKGDPIHVRLYKGQLGATITTITKE